MANPESLISLDTGNNLAFQNDPTLAGAVIPRIAVVSSVSAPSGSSATQSQLVDSAGNPLSTKLAPGTINPLDATLYGAGGNAVSTTLAPGASTNALMIGTYPTLLASWVNQTIGASAASSVFDARPYESIITQLVITALGGTSPTLTATLESQEPTSLSWWRVASTSAANAQNSAIADGAVIPTITGLVLKGVAATTASRPCWPNSRVGLVVTGSNTPQITFSLYVWGF